MSERDLVAHVTRLAHRQYSVDLGAYPLGSCTMKYNPKVCDEAAALPGLAGAHPATPAPYAQGWLPCCGALRRPVPDNGDACRHPAAPGGGGRRAYRPAHHEGVA